MKDRGEVRLFTGPLPGFGRVATLQEVGQHQVRPLLVAVVVVDLDGRREMLAVFVVADRRLSF